MSVIGRLDEQVEAVLISPLSKRDGEHAPHAPELVPQADAPRNETAGDSDKGETPARTAAETLPAAEADTHERRGLTGEMPVWML